FGRRAMEPGHHGDGLRQFERPYGLLRNRQGHGGEINRNPLAKRRAAEAREREWRPLPDDRRAVEGGGRSFMPHLTHMGVMPSVDVSNRPAPALADSGRL